MIESDCEFGTQIYLGNPMCDAIKATPFTG